MGLSDWLREARRWLWTIALGFAIILGASWCFSGRKPKAPKPPPPAPARVDPGVPTPGPTNEAPTAEIGVVVAVPKLTRSQVLEEAARFGLRLAPDELEAGERATVPGPPVEDGSDPPAVDPRSLEDDFPLKLGEETFTHPESGVAIDVGAFLLRRGERATLAGIWHQWQPPTPPASEVSCPSGGFFGNEGRATVRVSGPFVLGPKGFGYGAAVEAYFDGPRTKGITWGAGGTLVGGSSGDWITAGGLSLRFGRPPGTN